MGGPAGVGRSARARRALPFLPLIVCAGMVGCSCSVEAGTVSDDEGAEVDSTDVEQKISYGLSEQSGVSPSSVECPGEMVAEEGKRYECTVVHPQDGPQPVVVTMHADGGFRYDVP